MAQKVMLLKFFLLNEVFPRDNLILLPISLQITAHWLNKPTVCFYEVLLEHSQAHSFTYCLWLPLCYRARMSSCNRDPWPAKPKIISSPLQKKF